VSASGVRALLARHGLAPNRDLGQNFLVDETVAERLVALSGVDPGDTVIEIGSGLGVMTRALAARAERVVTIEVDAGLVRALEGEGALPDHVTVVHADALALDLSALARELGPRVRLVGNLPYAISSPLLRRLLDARAHLLGWSVMLQRELAERLVAVPGSRDYGSLTVLHALCVRVGKVMDLRPGCFYPAPKVRSTFLDVRPRPGEDPDAPALARVERVVRAAFGNRRKTLANALRAGLGADFEGPRIEAALEAAKLAPGLRAERVPPEAFVALADALLGGA
jgi:16S rRNA (adenine1518-N6/adenine1519-N6)-dimethyltransferase